MQRSATLPSLATRLNNLEQKFDGLDSGEDLVERLYKTLFQGAYTSTGAISSPWSANETTFDVSSAQPNRSSVIASIFGLNMGSASPGLKSTYDVGGSGVGVSFYEQVFQFGDTRFALATDDLLPASLSGTMFGAPNEDPSVDFVWWLRQNNTNVMSVTYGATSALDELLSREISLAGLVFEIETSHETLASTVSDISTDLTALTTTVSDLATSTGGRLDALETAVASLMTRVGDIENRLYAAHIP